MANFICAKILGEDGEEKIIALDVESFPNCHPPELVKFAKQLGAAEASLSYGLKNAAAARHLFKQTDK